MPVPYFQDIPIILEKVTTWPNSPDRTLINAGRERYSEAEIQAALTSFPTNVANFSQYKDFLQAYEPDKAGLLYKKDPVADLIKLLSNKNIYLQDDGFQTSIWKDVAKKIPVDKYARIKDKITNPTLYINGPTITDFGQSALPSCGFFSTIGALSLHPEAHNILFSAIYPAVYNPLGIYSVRITVNNEIRYLLLDDLLPEAGFSWQIKDQFWYFLIEKAFAKFSGGYNYLGGGKEENMGITSTPNTKITDDNKDQVWQEQFLDIFQKQQKDTYQGTGSSAQYLHHAHAYAVIDAAEWQNIRLVRMHNPWNNDASYDYTGPFAPGSSDWNQIPLKTQQELFQVNRFHQIDNAPPRTFWMPYDAYRTDIPKISCLYLNDEIPDSLKQIANTNPIQQTL